MGNSNEALKCHRQVVSIREALCKRDPSDNSWKRNLTVAYDSFGKYLTEQGDLDEALKLFTMSLDSAREMLNSDPTNTVKQRDVALTLVSIGKVYLKRSHPIVPCLRSKNHWP